MPWDGVVSIDSHEEFDPEGNEFCILNARSS